MKNNSQADYMMEAEAYTLMNSSKNPFYSGTNALFRWGMQVNNDAYGVGALNSVNASRAARLDFDCSSGERC